MTNESDNVKKDDTGSDEMPCYRVILGNSLKKPSAIMMHVLQSDEFDAESLEFAKNKIGHISMKAGEVDHVIMELEDQQNPSVRETYEGIVQTYSDQMCVLITDHREKTVTIERLGSCFNLKRKRLSTGPEKKKFQNDKLSAVACNEHSTASSPRKSLEVQPCNVRKQTKKGDISANKSSSSNESFDLSDIELSEDEEDPELEMNCENDEASCPDANQDDDDDNATVESDHTSIDNEVEDQCVDQDEKVEKQEWEMSDEENTQQLLAHRELDLLS
ncbi:hypothetical protein ACOME3_008735 [Neoechinorhynchus agilis]